jgi:hypothetical protein
MFEALLLSKGFTGAIAHKSIGTTEWQLRAELDTWLPVETSKRTPQFHVTYI